MQELRIVASDGYHLSALYGKPVLTSLGTIVLAPATGIKKEYYLHFAHYLIQQGYSVLLFDYRGIGSSLRGDIREIKSYMHEWGTKDMQAMIDYLVKEKNCQDIIWLGHSAGASLLGFTPNKTAVRKVVAVNAALGYWGHFPAPQKWLIYFLWKLIGPLMIGMYGYGKMKAIGWGENLPPNMLKQWRSWCLHPQYFRDTILLLTGKDYFEDFRIPMVSVYISDDYIANTQTARLLLDFFPHANRRLHQLAVTNLVNEPVGHNGLFRKRFERTLWPELMRIIEESE